MSKQNSNHTNYPYAVHNQRRDDAARVVERLELLPRHVHYQPFYVGLGRQEGIGCIYQRDEVQGGQKVSSKRMPFDVTTKDMFHAIKKHVTFKLCAVQSK